MVKRKQVSQKMRELVLRESGYRCAIPTCRVPVACEVAHIDSYAKSQNNDFCNLIALCPTCHTRYDRKEISKKSMKFYKQNLLILTGRYTDMERQIIEMFVLDQLDMMPISAAFHIAYRRLVQDKLFVIKNEHDSGFSINGIELGLVYLTPTKVVKVLLRIFGQAKWFYSVKVRAYLRVNSPVVCVDHGLKAVGTKKFIVHGAFI